MAGMFLAGAAAKVITPQLGERDVYLAGLPTPSIATGVAQPLYVRALALRYGKQVAIILSCDLYGLARDDLDEIRNTITSQGIDPKCLLVHATNAHNGPDTLGLWSGDHGADAVYLSTIKRALSQAAIEALTFGCPVKMRKIVVDKGNNPLTILQFERPSTEILATIALSRYPTNQFSGTPEISSNATGLLCQQLEQAFGGTAMVLVGAHQPEHPQSLQVNEALIQHIQQGLQAAELQEIEQLIFDEHDIELVIDQTAWQNIQAQGLGRVRKPSDTYSTRCCYLAIGDQILVTVPGLLASTVCPPASGNYTILACTDDMLGELDSSLENKLNPSSQTAGAVSQALKQLLQKHNMAL
jgi:hypothetical protein